MKTNFRNKNNTLITKNLFKEISTNPEKVVYSLEREDSDYPSLYKLYLKLEDLTEFEFANKYFESYEHWKIICQTDWFHSYIAGWREELELKIRAKALTSLINRMEGDPITAKYLLDKNWVEKLHEKNPVVNLRGRPSKQDIKNHLTLITNEKILDQENYERIKNIK